MKDMNELFSVIETLNEPVELDFRNPAHLELVYAIYGGEENFKEQFPHRYSALQNSLAGMLSADDGDVFADDIALLYGVYSAEEKRVSCRAVTSVKTEAESINEYISVYDSKRRVQVASAGNSTPSAKHTVMKLEQSRDLSGVDLRYCTVNYYSDWDDNNALRAKVYRIRCEKLEQETNVVEQIRVADPVHRQTAKDDYIRVCYQRSPKTGESIDYNYRQDIGEKGQRLYLDVGASVDLVEDARPFRTVNVASLLLKLDSQQGIASYYAKEDRQGEIWRSFQKTDTGFTFQLNNDWQGIVPSKRLPEAYEDPIDFYMRCEFSCGDSLKGTFSIMSSPGFLERRSDTVQISQLQMLWGCLAGNVRVRMADGSKRPARDVEIGDRVRLLTGEGTVSEVYTGSEEKLVRIMTENGRELTLTHGHPVLTRRGWVSARRLNGEDEIVNEERGYDRIRYIYEVDGGEVFNYDIVSQEEAVLICEGLAVGDNRMQKQCMDAEKEADRAYEPDEESLRLKEWMGKYES